MASMTDTMVLLAALTAFGVLILGWMMLPIATGTGVAATAGRPLGAVDVLGASAATAG
jgi:hypothetical protein